MIDVVAACVESSINIVGNVFIEIIGLNVINEEVSVHITQLKILGILGKHVVIMKFAHNNLTEINNRLAKVIGFVHENCSFSYFASH